MPLPSPADSPLARRVTNERDEHGFPTSPALLELLQQRAAAEAAAAGSWGEGAEQQHVPWISVQLRAVPQQLSDECSSANQAAAANTSPPWLPLIIRHTSLDVRSSSNDSSSPCSQLRHSKSTTVASGKATAAAAAAAAAVAEAEAAAYKNRVAQLAALHSAAAAAAAAGSARRDQRLARQLQDSGGVHST
jgi:hypothetical protein